MDKIIYTYALIKSLYDVENDYVECFMPFIIKAFSNENELNSSYIQTRVKVNSNLDIPIHTLNTILYQAKKRGLVEKNKDMFNVTKDGLEYLDKSENEKDVNRRIKALIDDMKNFFLKNENELSHEEIQDLLCSFISENYKNLVNFLNPKNPKKINNQKLEGYQDILLKYIEVAENKKPEHYKTLRDMILGSLISVTIYTKKPSQLNKIKDNWINCQIFFDTNFIFSLLNLHNSNFNDPAQELFKLLNKNEFELKLFDFTLNEISSVLNSYISERNRYPESIKVNSLYSNLKRKNWSKSDVIKYISDLESTLKEKGIEIENTNVDLATYEPKNKKIINKLESYKEFQPVRGQLHDLAAIDLIKRIRNRTIHKLEDSNAFFLTSDLHLSKFNFIEMYHRDQNTITEVILDRVLTNILWLKDPNADISLKAIIESYSQDLFVNKRVWNKFYDVLQQLSNDKKINDEDISMLFYHGQLESTLIGMDDNDIDSITSDFIIKEIENAGKLQKKDLESMEKKEENFLKQLDDKTLVHNKEIDEIKENLKKAAENDSNRFATIISTIIMLSIWVVGGITLIEIYSILNQSGNTALLIIFIGFSALFVTFSGVPKHQSGLYSQLHLRFKNWKFKRSHRKKLDEAKLS
jgi:hypothetical protein